MAQIPNMGKVRPDGFDWFWGFSHVMVSVNKPPAGPQHVFNHPSAEIMGSKPKSQNPGVQQCNLKSNQRPRRMLSLSTTILDSTGFDTHTILEPIMTAKHQVP